MLIHTEVQGEESAEFPYRVWEYNALWLTQMLRRAATVSSLEELIG